MGLTLSQSSISSTEDGELKFSVLYEAPLDDKQDTSDSDSPIDSDSEEAPGVENASDPSSSVETCIENKAESTESTNSFVAPSLDLLLERGASYSSLIDTVSGEESQDEAKDPELSTSFDADGEESDVYLSSSSDEDDVFSSADCDVKNPAAQTTIKVRTISTESSPKELHNSSDLKPSMDDISLKSREGVRKNLAKLPEMEDDGSVFFNAGTSGSQIFPFDQLHTKEIVKSLDKKDCLKTDNGRKRKHPSNSDETRSTVGKQYCLVSDVKRRREELAHQIQIEFSTMEEELAANESDSGSDPPGWDSTLDEECLTDGTKDAAAEINCGKGSYPKEMKTNNESPVDQESESQRKFDSELENACKNMSPEEKKAFDAMIMDAGLDLSMDSTIEGDIPPVDTKKVAESSTVSEKTNSNKDHYLSGPKTPPKNDSEPVEREDGEIPESPCKPKSLERQKSRQVSPERSQRRYSRERSPRSRRPSSREGRKRNRESPRRHDKYRRDSDKKNSAGSSRRNSPQKSVRDRLGSRDDSARHESRRGSRDDIGRRRNREDKSRRPSRDDKRSRHPSPRLRETSPILPEKPVLKSKRKRSDRKRGPRVPKNNERSRTSTPLAEASEPSTSKSTKMVQSQSVSKQPVLQKPKATESSPINPKLLSMIQPKKS